jgi:hypothetical protein
LPSCKLECVAHKLVLTVVGDSQPFFNILFIRQTCEHSERHLPSSFMILVGIHIGI